MASDRSPIPGAAAESVALETARTLAAALDAEDYLTARRALDSACVYEVGDEVHEGPDAILASYAASAAWVRRTFDDVRYESLAEPLPDGRVSVLYTDYLVLAGGRMHRHRCRQTLTIASDGHVTRIEHQDLPGEREALEAFFDAAGIERP